MSNDSNSHELKESFDSQFEVDGGDDDVKAASWPCSPLCVIDS